MPPELPLQRNPVECAGMHENLHRAMLPIGFLLFSIYILYGLVSRPGSASSYSYLGGLIFVEIVVAALWNYHRSLFPMLMLVFLSAGTDTPLKGLGTSARWLVLAAGALVGFIIYMRGNHSFATIHLLGLFCIIAALVSAMVSNYPKLALLKTGSLLLVLLYGACGARLGVIGREAKFVAGLLWGCEIVVYFSAFEYFVLHEPFFGNPNSLGVVTGIVTTPVLLWGAIVSAGTRSYPRRIFALLISVLLVLSSYSRAGIGAAVLSSVLLCLATRHYRLLLKGGLIALAAAFLIAATVPLPDNHDVHTDTLVDVFLYKGKTEEGVFGSRQSPWTQTSAIIRAHPWFGSGFGTSITSIEGWQIDYAFQSTYGSLREHGNSYLEILEWVGILGMVPFVLLIGTIAVNAARATAALFRSADPMSPLAPITMILIAGLGHAAFEDWLFAPGYYMCVLFWALAFVQADLLALAAPAVAPRPRYPAFDVRGDYGVLSPGR